MARILIRPAFFAVTTLSLLLLLTGCSSNQANPRDQANSLVTEANGAISEHNQLFKEARSDYEGAKKAVEAGETTSQDTTSQDTTSKDAERFTQTRETMQQARDKLTQAQSSLAGVQDLNVASEIKDYAKLLSEAIDDQLAAEAKEIEFYAILEQDPTLSENRKKALSLLGEADDGYKKAKDAFGRAQAVADANPKLLQKG